GGVESGRAGAIERGGVDDRAGRVGGSVDAVGADADHDIRLGYVSGTTRVRLRYDPRTTRVRLRLVRVTERQRELLIPAALALTPHRDRRLPARHDARGPRQR